MKQTWKKIVSVVLALSLVLPLSFAFAASANTEEVVNEPWDTDGDGVLELLTVGNSYTEDLMRYAGFLALNLGVKKIHFGFLYYPGCTLAQHADFTKNEKKVYEFSTSLSETSGRYSKVFESTSGDAIKSHSWDYVVLQQAPAEAGMPETYNEDLEYMINYVNGVLKDEANPNANPNFRFLWHMTWANQNDFTHEKYPLLGGDQLIMYNLIAESVQEKIVKNDVFYKVVPSGTAIQNARTSFVGDHMTRDGYHMSKDKGRYTIGLMLMKTLGLDVSDVSYVPDGVNEAFRKIAVESVNNAHANPFSVTKSSYTDPLDGYLVSELNLHLGKCWNATSSNFNKLIDNGACFTTDRLTREDLPEGSVILLADGWQYRPEGWLADEQQDPQYRPETLDDAYIVISDDWWGDYTLRAFNVSREDGASLKDLTEEEMKSVFRILKVKPEHTFDNACDSTCNDEGCDFIRPAGHVYDNAEDAICNQCEAERTLPPYDLCGATGDCFWYRKGTKLTVIGNGKMGNYTSTNKAPWGTSVTEVILEEGVTAVGNRAFYDCKALTSVAIPASVKSIGDRAFCKCDHLVSVTIGSGVETIGTAAFYGCSALTSITLTASVTSIGVSAFSDCTSFESVWYEGSESDKADITIGIDNDLLLNATWHYVDHMLDTKCNVCDEERTLPYDDYGTTGDCFWYREGTKLTVFGSGEMARYASAADVPWGTSITEAVIEHGVTYVGSYAFNGCTALTSVTLPNTVETISARAFAGCTALASIALPASLEAIGSRAFENCTALTSVVIPEGVETIVGYAFNGCTALKSVSIPNSVTSIEGRAFYGCSALTSVTLPASVTTINDHTFNGCANLSSVTILGPVESIGAGAFANCKKLTSINIPASVTSIGSAAFKLCTKLAAVWYEGSESDQGDIAIGASNDPLTAATWHYNSCMQNPGTWTHVYEDASDVLCDECGYAKLQVASSLSLTVEERIYLNLWLDAEDVDAYKELTGKDFTYDATMGERSLGAGSVTGTPVETEYGTYYIVRLDAVSANLFGEQISIDCPTGVINAVGDEDLTVLNLAKEGTEAYEEQEVKDLFTALYNYGASATSQALLPMPETFVEDQKDNIQVTAKDNETASFQSVYLLMGDSIGIRLKGKLLGDQNALSVKVNGNENNACKLNVGADGTLTIDLYVSADYFNSNLTIEVYGEGEVIASFDGTVKGYSEQIADQDAKTLALAQFVQACVNYKAA